jgi:hypothetical protein
MAVIPKLSINPGALHTARRKLQSKQPDERVQLSANEREAVLRLIQRAKRQLYPGPQQIDSYQYLIKQLTDLNPNTQPAKFNQFVEKIKNFEQKWCK